MVRIKIHPLSDVQTVYKGHNTQIWQYSVILKNAVIGKDCNVNCHTLIENDVILGDRVTLKSGIYLWDGITIADDVFLGPNVNFVNDNYPRSKLYLETFARTKIEKFVFIGANAIILGGVNFGEYALIGAGSVVTKSVPAFSLVKGNPGRIVGEVDERGNVVERF